MSYSYFAEYYDGLTEDVDYEQKADYFLRLLKKHGHEAGVTLDLACGTGTFTLALKKRGIDVFGADMSEEMLTEAQMKACEADESIMFICCKMQELCLPGLIDTCVCTLDSINHITSKKELVKAFTAVSAYLADDGLFVFDANTVYKHKEILGNNCFIFDTENIFCAWQNNFQPRNNKVIITLDFFKPEGKKYIRSSEQFAERAYTFDEMKYMLDSAGLFIEAVYADMSFDKPDEKTQREIYVVRKNKNEQ